jgi:hypothetical protein
MLAAPSIDNTYILVPASIGKTPPPLAWSHIRLLGILPKTLKPKTLKRQNLIFGLALVKLKHYQT